jgi:hypothetical protein
MKKRTTKRKNVDTPTTRKRNAGEARLRQHGENNIRKGKGIKNKDGSVSSVRSTSVRTKSGKEMLVPTVYDGKQVSAPEAKKRALKAEKAGGAKYPRYRSAQKATAASKKVSSKINTKKKTRG